MTTQNDIDVTPEETADEVEYSAAQLNWPVYNDEVSSDPVAEVFRLLAEDRRLAQHRIISDRHWQEAGFPIRDDKPKPPITNHHPAVVEQRAHLPTRADRAGIIRTAMPDYNSGLKRR